MSQPGFTTSYILLGSNVAALANLRAALALLRRYADVFAVSSVYRSAAAGSAGGAPYLNAAVGLRVTGTPEAFKRDVLRSVETALGRRRDGSTPTNEVPIDLDILLWGDAPLVYGDKPWHSPSPDTLTHAFVALPLAEIAPDVLHPDTGDTLLAVARRFANAPVENLGPLLADDTQTLQSP